MAPHEWRRRVPYPHIPFRHTFCPPLRVAVVAQDRARGERNDKESKAPPPFSVGGEQANPVYISPPAPTSALRGHHHVYRLSCLLVSHAGYTRMVFTHTQPPHVFCIRGKRWLVIIHHMRGTCPCRRRVVSRFAEHRSAFPAHPIAMLPWRRPHTVRTPHIVNVILATFRGLFVVGTTFTGAFCAP